MAVLAIGSKNCIVWQFSLQEGTSTNSCGPQHITRGGKATKLLHFTSDGKSLSILQVRIVLFWTDKPKLRRPSGFGSHTTAKKGSACLRRTAFLKGKSTDAEKIKDSSTTLTVAVDQSKDRDHRVEPGDRVQWSKNVRALPEPNIGRHNAVPRTPSLSEPADTDD